MNVFVHNSAIYKEDPRPFQIRIAAGINTNECYIRK